MSVRAILPLLIISLAANAAQASKCRLDLSQIAPGLGLQDAQVLEKLGAPVDAGAVTPNKTWLLYGPDQGRWLTYGTGAEGEYAGFRVFQRDTFYVNSARKVVGYVHSVSHHPNKLQSIQQAAPWASALRWEMKHQINRYEALLATHCGDEVIMLHAACYPFAGVDPDTYHPTTVIPKSLEQCRYRGTYVFEASAVKRTSVVYTPTEVPARDAPPSPTNEATTPPAVAERQAATSASEETKPRRVTRFDDVATAKPGDVIVLDGVPFMNFGGAMSPRPCAPSDDSHTQVIVGGLPKVVADVYDGHLPVTNDGVNSCFDITAKFVNYMKDRGDGFPTATLTWIKSEQNGRGVRIHGPAPWDAQAGEEGGE